jgi:hypothetical protein
MNHESSVSMTWKENSWKDSPLECKRDEVHDVLHVLSDQQAFVSKKFS